MSVPNMNHPQVRRVHLAGRTKLLRQLVQREAAWHWGVHERQGRDEGGRLGGRPADQVEQLGVLWEDGGETREGVGEDGRRASRGRACGRTAGGSSGTIRRGEDGRGRDPRGRVGGRQEGGRDEGGRVGGRPADQVEQLGGFSWQVRAEAQRVRQRMGWWRRSRGGSGTGSQGRDPRGRLGGRPADQVEQLGVLWEDGGETREGVGEDGRRASRGRACGRTAGGSSGTIRRGEDGRGRDPRGRVGGRQEGGRDEGGRVGGRPADQVEQLGGFSSGRSGVGGSRTRGGRGNDRG